MACPVESVNVVQTAGAGGGAGVGVVLGVAVGVAEGLAGAEDSVATTLLAGSGAVVSAPRFVATRTPAVTAAAAIVMAPAIRARRRRRASSRGAMPARPVSLKTAGSVSIRCRAASPSGTDGSLCTGSAAEILFLIGSISGTHRLCGRSGRD